MYTTLSMVFAIIPKLDPHKAGKLDGIPVIVLKKCAPEMTLVLSRLYNKCLVAFLLEGNSLL